MACTDNFLVTPIGGQGVRKYCSCINPFKIFFNYSIFSNSNGSHMIYILLKKYEQFLLLLWKNSLYFNTSLAYLGLKYHHSLK